MIASQQELISASIHEWLSHEPAKALQLLGQLPELPQKQTLALAIAHSWARQDINAAWSAVAHSSMSASEKQFMFNELWG
jgi:hypothetical protein